jgi:hypothetical protein
VTGAVSLALLACVASVGFSQAEEQETTFSYGAEMELASRYLWRGIELSDGIVAEPFVWGTANGFSLSWWANMPLEGTNSGVFDEVDATLQYSFSWGRLTVEPGITGYFYPHQPDVPDTTELLLKLAYPLGPVELSIEHDHDIDAYSGASFDEVAASWTGAKSSRGLTPDAQVSLGFASSKFNEANVGASSSGLNYVLADVGLTYEVSGALYARAHVGVLRTVADAVREALSSDGRVFGGVVVGFEL